MMRTDGERGKLTWAEKVALARGWIELCRWAERRRRELEGRPLLELVR